MIAVTAFWISQGIFLVSDNIDSQNIDDRRPFSRWINNIGLVFGLIAVVAGIYSLVHVFTFLALWHAFG